MRLLAALAFIFFSCSLMTNGQTVSFQKEGDVVVYQDARIDSLVKQHIKLNKAFPGIDGYRVMIFFDAGNNSKDTAYRVMIEFNEEYPDVPAYISFNPPYYRVRVGNFRTELEAVRFGNKIRYDYPNAWVVETTIELPELRAKNEYDY